MYGKSDSAASESLFSNIKPFQNLELDPEKSVVR
jgi:hypothetical protein